MPHALVTLAGYYTAAGAGTGVATPAPGTTFVPVDSQNQAAIYLEQVHAAGAVTDFVRIRSNRMHDPINGIKLYTGATQRRALLPADAGQTFYQGDALTVEIDATGAGTGGILAQYGYDDLSGANPTLASWNEVRPRIKQIFSTEVDVTSGAIGAWGAGAAINTPVDNFKADSQYAWLGYEVSVACLGIAMIGAATGNQQIGGPGSTDPLDTRDYFVRLSNKSGRSYIPLINANNRGATLLQSVDVAAATVSKVNLILGWLG